MAERVAGETRSTAPFALARWAGIRTPVETPTPTGETAEERVDRELSELLHELRILLPGVQLVFAFLLTAPFSSAFDELTTSEHVAYIIAFAASAVASVLLIAPVAHHRARFRQGDKEALLRRGEQPVAGGDRHARCGPRGDDVSWSSRSSWRPGPGRWRQPRVAAIELWLWVGGVVSRPTLAERNGAADVTQGV